MEAVELVFEGNSVPTLLGTDCCADMQQRLKALLEPAPDKFFICSEAAIYAACGGASMFTPEALGAPVEVVLMGKGEAEKSAETLLAMTQQCFAGGVSKRSVIVALGGGVLLNVAGLAAALIYRGIRLVHMPTTLMAQHDVITSLKTAVNLCGRKNNFGTHYPSILNLVDVDFLRTLPPDQYMSGVGELCKNALILGGEHADVFERVMRPYRAELTLTSSTSSAWKQLTAHSLELVKVANCNTNANLFEDKAGISFETEQTQRKITLCLSFVY